MRWQDAPAVGEAATAGNQQPRWMAAPAADAQPQRKTARQQYEEMGYTQVAGQVNDGFILRNPANGQQVYTSPGYNTSDPDEVAKLAQGATPAQTFWDEAIIDANPVAARAAKAVEGVPFLGTYADEAVGAVFGDEARDTMRTTSAAMDREKPWQSAGLQLGGGLLAAVPALWAAGPSLAANSLGGNVARGSGLGLLEGYARGFGRGEDGAKARVHTGLIDGILGAGVGAAVPLAAHGASAGWRAGRNALNEMRGIGSVADDLGVDRRAVGAVGNYLGMDDPRMAQAALSRPNSMLADAGPSTRGLLDSVMQTPGESARTAMQRIDDRAGQASYGILDALSGGRQGPQMPPIAAQRQMAQQARGNINPAYQRAYNSPIDYASDAGRRIEDIVDRLPPSTARKAIQRATDRMIYDGAPSPQIMASIADDGTVTLTQKPNVIQLDYLKRAFDEIAEDGKDAVTGRLSSDGAFAARIARDLREATADAVPAYREALSSAATDIRQRAAVRTGGELLRSQTTVEQAAEAIADATPAELRAMRQGVTGQIEHVLGNVRAVASDPDIDARQALTAFKELSSPNAQRKMQALFGDEWPGIRAALDEAGAALGVRASVAANSATFRRGEFNDMLNDMIEPGAFRRGEPITTGKEVWQRATGAAKDQVGRMKANVRNDIADLLTRPDARSIYDAVDNARSMYPTLPTAGRGLLDAIMAMGAGSAPTLGNELRKRLPQQQGRSTKSRQ